MIKAEVEHPEEVAIDYNIVGEITDLPSNPGKPQKYRLTSITKTITSAKSPINISFSTPIKREINDPPYDIVIDSPFL